MGKSEADSCKKISAFFLRKHGYFKGYQAGTITWTSGYDEKKSSVSIAVSMDSDGDTGHLQISYTQTDHWSEEKKDFDYKIPITSTPCHYGGRRFWFICPMYRNQVYCGKRVAVLYKDGDLFACRHCYNLTYSSRNYHFGSRLPAAFRVLEIDTKIEKLEEKIKRRTWRGRPTRKQRRLERLYRQAEFYYGAFSKEDLLK